MSTRTTLYALAFAVALLTLPAAASAAPVYDTGTFVAPTAAPAASSGLNPLLIVGAALVVVLVVAALRLVRVRPTTVKA